MEFIITRTDNAIAINSFTDTQPGQYKVETDTLNNRVLIVTMGYKWEIDLNSDTVTVNEEEFEGAAEALKTLLYSDVFADLGSSDSPGGSSYLVWDAAYQNSAMSAPVGAYLYKDGDGVIWKVYEPSRNNAVSRTALSYTDSIDKFPFDNVDCLGNVFMDAKLVDMASDVVMEYCEFQNMIIKFNDHTGVELLRVIWVASELGTDTPNDAEIYITGNGVVLENVTAIGGRNCIDSIGADCTAYGLTMLNDTNKIFCQNKTGLYFGDGVMWEDGSDITFHFDDSVFYDFQIGGSAEVHVGGGNNNFGFIIGDGATLGSSSFTWAQMSHVVLGNGGVISPDTNNTRTISYINVGMGVVIQLAGDLSNKEYKNIDGTAYVLGVADGAVTATPV